LFTSLDAVANAGTDYWRAPEVANEEIESSEFRITDYDHRCDVYSLGLVAFYSLTKQHFNRTIPLASQWRGFTVHQNLKDLIKNMITAEPHKRTDFSKVQLEANSLLKELQSQS